MVQESDNLHSSEVDSIKKLVYTQNAYVRTGFTLLRSDGVVNAAKSLCHAIGYVCIKNLECLHGIISDLLSITKETILLIEQQKHGIFSQNCFTGVEDMNKNDDIHRAIESTVLDKTSFVFAASALWIACKLLDDKMILQSDNGKEFLVECGLELNKVVMNKRNHDAFRLQLCDIAEEILHLEEIWSNCCSMHKDSPDGAMEELSTKQSVHLQSRRVSHAIDLHCLAVLVSLSLEFSGSVIRLTKSFPSTMQETPELSHRIRSSHDSSNHLLARRLLPQLLLRVVRHLSNPIYRIRQAAHACASCLALHTDCESISQLISNNIDYLVDHVCSRLRVSHSFEDTPALLYALALHVPANSIAYLEETVNLACSCINLDYSMSKQEHGLYTTLRALEYFARSSTLFLQQAKTKDSKDSQPNSTIFGNANESKLKQDLLTFLKQEQAESNIFTDQSSDFDQYSCESDTEAATKNRDHRDVSIRIIQTIMNKVKHFISYPTLRVRIAAIDCLVCAVDGLSKGGEDKFLPLVSQIWPSVRDQIRTVIQVDHSALQLDPQPFYQRSVHKKPISTRGVLISFGEDPKSDIDQAVFLLISIFKLCSILIRLCPDFISQRYRSDIWPPVCSLLINLCQTNKDQARCDNMSSPYWPITIKSLDAINFSHLVLHTPQFKRAIAGLQLIEQAAQHKNLVGSITWQVAKVILPYLWQVSLCSRLVGRFTNSRQIQLLTQGSQQIGNLVFNILTRLCSISPDTCWTALLDAVASIVHPTKHEEIEYVSQIMYYLFPSNVERFSDEHDFFLKFCQHVSLFKT